MKVQESKNRINKELNESYTSFEAKSIQNLFNINPKQFAQRAMVGIAIDIVGSSKLRKNFKATNVGKIIQAFVKESIIIMRESGKCKKIMIHGDAVIALYENEENLDFALDIAIRLNTYMGLLNVLIKKKFNSDYDFQTGIGIAHDYKNLSIKVGTAKETFKDIVIIGDSINYAVKYADAANRNNKRKIILDTWVFKRLSNSYQEDIKKWYGDSINYENDFFMIDINAVFINDNKEIKNMV